MSTISTNSLCITFSSQIFWNKFKRIFKTFFEQKSQIREESSGSNWIVKFDFNQNTDLERFLGTLTKSLQRNYSFRLNPLDIDKNPNYPKEDIANIPIELTSNISYHGVTYDINTNYFSFEGENILKAKSTIGKFLIFLYRFPGKVVSFKDLHAHLYISEPYYDNRTIISQMNNLRNTIKKEGAIVLNENIKRVPGGYILHV